MTDRHKMREFVCRRIPADGTRIVLADGPEGGLAWADLFPVRDDDGDCDLHIETNDPEWVGLRAVYEHFRCNEMPSKSELNSSAVRKDQTDAEFMDRQSPNVGCRAITNADLKRIECSLEGKLDKITSLLVQQKTVKEWYATSEVAERLGNAAFTVREWCRLGQCNAEKRKPYRGGKKQWMISHDEMLNLESDGPAPHGTFHR